MPGILSTAFLFALLCAAASGGFVVKSRLPERHRSRNSFELVQLSINLLVTFTAIVLGLLTNSVKNGFDAAYSERGAYAASLVQLDHCLRDYGPETAAMQEQMQSYTAAVIASTWPDEPPPTGSSTRTRLGYPSPEKADPLPPSSTGSAASSARSSPPIRFTSASRRRAWSCIGIWRGAAGG